jgi:NAD-dependent dihydropyrimidine dehydrogenase PreA subunit
MQVDLEKCTGCETCLDVCNNNAISLVAGKAAIELDTCMDCGTCALACPVGAITQVEQPVLDEAIPVHSIVLQEAALLELSTSERLAPWAGAVLVLMGREIVPRIADALIAAFERRSSQPARLPVTISQPLAHQSNISKGSPRRRHRRAGWR